MTYTFKLARRLAVSRRLGILPAILLFVACSGDDATAPGSDSPGPRAVPATVSVHPNRVTVEANQLIRFLAFGRNSAGDSVSAPIIWQATGGTILADGRFSSAAVGTFMVIGRTPVRGVVMGRTRYSTEERVDTSMVTVVRRHPNLGSIEISPDTATLASGASQRFLVTGRLTDGRAVPVGVTWKAAGGSIDAGGNFVAGDSAGTYRVIATHTTFTFADTATVTITAPLSPPPPEEPPAPVLETVTLVPASATLAPAATRQFTAYGRTITGDSVSVSIVFAATGGTVTEDGLYTAGSTAGSYRIIATSGTLADSSSLTVTRPLGSGPPGTGIPVGLAALLSAGVDPGPYNMSVDAYRADIILARLNEARAKNLTVVMAMTGGGHPQYMTDGVFDMAKWRAKMDTYNTPAIKAAVAAGVADGTIIGNSVMDEPHNHWFANTWGPEGTMNKARVDGMCAYVKNIFPTLPVGVVHDFTVLEPEKNYQACEFLLTQYRQSKGDVVAYRNAALAFGRRSGVSIIFALNVLHGGPASASCPKYGDDPNGMLCPMTPEQVRSWGLTLGEAGCALNMWRFEAAYFNEPTIQSAVRTVADALTKLPRKACTRV